MMGCSDQGCIVKVMDVCLSVPRTSGNIHLVYSMTRPLTYTSFLILRGLSIVISKRSRTASNGGCHLEMHLTI